MKTRQRGEGSRAFLVPTDGEVRSEGGRITAGGRSGQCVLPRGGWCSGKEIPEARVCYQGAQNEREKGLYLVRGFALAGLLKTFPSLLTTWRVNSYPKQRVLTPQLKRRLCCWETVELARPVRPLFSLPHPCPQPLHSGSHKIPFRLERIPLLVLPSS